MQHTSPLKREAGEGDYLYQNHIGYKSFHFIEHLLLIDYFCGEKSFNPIKYSYEIKCQNC